MEEEKLVCLCYGITDREIRKLILKHDLRTVNDVEKLIKAGGSCGGCTVDIQEMLDEIRAAQISDTILSRAGRDNDNIRKKLLLVQQIIDQEMKPYVRKIGADMELSDLAEDRVEVRFYGDIIKKSTTRRTTLQLFEAKIERFFDDGLTVEEAE